MDAAIEVVGAEPSKGFVPKLQLMSYSMALTLVREICANPKPPQGIHHGPGQCGGGCSYVGCVTAADGHLSSEFGSERTISTLEITM